MVSREESQPITRLIDVRPVNPIGQVCTFSILIYVHRSKLKQTFQVVQDLVNIFFPNRLRNNSDAACMGAFVSSRFSSRCKRPTEDDTNQRKDEQLTDD